MKHVYILTIVGLAFIAPSIPQTAFSQCTCSSGLPATGISYSATVPLTKTSTIVFSLPQFNPATGDLACVRVHDTISGITVSSALNSDPVDSAAFQFLLT